MAVSDQELMDIDGGQGHFRNGRRRVAGQNPGRGSYTAEERENARRTGSRGLGALSMAALAITTGGAAVAAVATKTAVFAGAKTGAGAFGWVGSVSGAASTVVGW